MTKTIVNNSTDLNVDVIDFKNLTDSESLDKIVSFGVIDRAIEEQEAIVKDLENNLNHEVMSTEEKWRVIGQVEKLNESAMELMGLRLYLKQSACQDHVGIPLLRDKIAEMKQQLVEQFDTGISENNFNPFVEINKQEKILANKCKRYAYYVLGILDGEVQSVLTDEEYKRAGEKVNLEIYKRESLVTHFHSLKAHPLTDINIVKMCNALIKINVDEIKVRKDFMRSELKRIMN